MALRTPSRPTHVRHGPRPGGGRLHYISLASRRIPRHVASVVSRGLLAPDMAGRSALFPSPSRVRRHSQPQPASPQVVPECLPPLSSIDGRRRMRTDEYFIGIPQLPQSLRLRGGDEVCSELGEDLLHLLVGVVVDRALGDDVLEEVSVRSLHVCNKLLLERANLGDGEFVEVSTSA